MTTSATRPRNSKIITKQDHETIQQKCDIDGEKGEDYAVVLQRGKGFWIKSIHVFSRHPTTKEINDYEQTASRLKFKGQKAQVEGSAINAAVAIYNVLVARSYDVLIGLKEHAQLDAELSRAKVPPMVKREAIRDLIAEVYSASRMAEMEGEDDEVLGDDDSEEHTESGE